MCDMKMTDVEKAGKVVCAAAQLANEYRNEGNFEAAEGLIEFTQLPIVTLCRFYEILKARN